MGRADGHLLDETQLDARCQAEVEQIGRVRIVHPAHHHGVDLDRCQAGGPGCGYAGQHIGQPIPVGDLPEMRGVEGVQGDVDPPQPGSRQRLGPMGQTEPIGGQRQVGWGSLVGDQPGTAGDDVCQAAAQQGFATGEADLADTQPPHGDGAQPQHFGIGQGLFIG